MALSINNNLMALTAANNLTRSYGTLLKSINRLSSGLRINGAADDAAGLAVRELMRSDIAVLQQGVRNANDAISMLQTMDGAAAVIDEKLIRMKELAEQASTGTYSSAQRSIMNDEFDAMRAEIDRIAKATDFNGIKMLNSGSTGIKEVLTHAGDANNFWKFSPLSGAFTDFVSGETIYIHWTASDGTEGFDTTVVGASGTEIQSLEVAINGISSFDGTANWTSGVGMIITGDSPGNTKLGLSLTDGTSSYFFTTTTEGKDGEVRVHFGTGNDSAEDYYFVNSHNMTQSGLGISAVSISSQASAAAALTAIDLAIIQKDTARAHFGAMMNRLENTVSNLTLQAENIQAAESQISDVDVAFEMTNFMNTQIKAQAAVAMLSQANSMPQMAMSLLQA